VNAQQIRETIINADDSYREPLNVEVPWNLNGDKLYVRRLPFGTIKPWIRDGELVITGNDIPHLVVRALVTEHGEQIFADRDAKALDTKDHDVITAIFREVLRVGGISEEGQEETEETFGEAQSDEPSSG
jgi:hypothetical protein